MSAHDGELIDRLGIELPIVQAPLAGSSGVALAVAVARADPRVTGLSFHASNGRVEPG